MCHEPAFLVQSRRVANRSTHRVAQLRAGGNGLVSAVVVEFLRSAWANQPHRSAVGQEIGLGARSKLMPRQRASWIQRGLYRDESTI